MEHCVLPPAQLPRALASNTTLSDVVHGAGGGAGGTGGSAGGGEGWAPQWSEVQTNRLS